MVLISFAIKRTIDKKINIYNGPTNKSPLSIREHGTFVVIAHAFNKKNTKSNTKQNLFIST